MPTTDLTATIPDEEILERFVPKQHVNTTGLKWQAVRLRPNETGLSVAQLSIGIEACRVAGAFVMNNGLFGFAETVAGAMRTIRHEVFATPGPFVGHAEIRLSGIEPGWPVPYEPGPATPEKLAEVKYYESLVRHFRFRPLDEEDVEIEDGPVLGPASPALRPRE